MTKWAKQRAWKEVRSYLEAWCMKAGIIIQ